MYLYLIVYTYVEDGVMMPGNIEAESKNPITGIEAIRDMEKAILLGLRKDNFEVTHVVLTNAILISEPDEDSVDEYTAKREADDDLEYSGIYSVPHSDMEG